jgi:hypothetical protein
MSPKTVRHYRVRRNNRAFWEPTAKMKKAGFALVALGLDSPDAVMLAEQWNERWDRARAGLEPSPIVAASKNLSPELASKLV